MQKVEELFGTLWGRFVERRWVTFLSPRGSLVETVSRVEDRWQIGFGPRLRIVRQEELCSVLA
jgi:hypothetical protein